MTFEIVPAIITQIRQAEPLQWRVAEESRILEEWMELHNAKIEDLID